MRNLKFMASIAGKALALALTVIMGMAFTACSNDDPEVEKPKENFFKFDGTNLKAASVSSVAWGNRFVFYVEFEQNEHGYSKHHFYIEGILPERTNSGTIDLTKQNSNDSAGSWEAMYRMDGTDVFMIGLGKEYAQTFLSGTMSVKIINPQTREIEISVTNARVIDNKYGDGKEHTISLYFKGITEEYTS